MGVPSAAISPGYINQRAVLTRRAGAVATLHNDASAEWIGYAG
jgi:feruloyl-CoA synthase